MTNFRKLGPIHAEPILEAKQKKSAVTSVLDLKGNKTQTVMDYTGKTKKGKKSQSPKQRDGVLTQGKNISNRNKKVKQLKDSDQDTDRFANTSKLTVDRKKFSQSQV